MLQGAHTLDAPVCPVQAIFPLEELPEKWANYTQIDADWYKK